MTEHSTEEARVTREHHPKGITVYPDGSSVEIPVAYDVLKIGPLEARFRSAKNEGDKP